MYSSKPSLEMRRHFPIKQSMLGIARSLQGAAVPLPASKQAKKLSWAPATRLWKGSGVEERERAARACLYTTILTMCGREGPIGKGDVRAACGLPNRWLAAQRGQVAGGCGSFASLLPPPPPPCLGQPQAAAPCNVFPTPGEGLPPSPRRSV